MNLQERITEVIAHGLYRQCPTCRAGASIGEFPSDWSLTVSRGRFKEGGPIHPLTFTPHRNGCEEVTDTSRFGLPIPRAKTRTDE